MAISQFQMLLLNSGVQIMRGFVTNKMNNDRRKESEEDMSDYYKKAMVIAKEHSGQSESYEYEELSETSEGKSCLTCTKEHFTQASTLLEEAANFSLREKGMRNAEVTGRMHAALQQFLAAERWDLKPEAIDRLPGERKALARWAKNRSSELRHMLNNAKTSDDLNKVASEASRASKEMFGKVLEMGPEEEEIDMVQKLCGHLQGDAREQCIEAVNPVLP